MNEKQLIELINKIDLDTDIVNYLETEGCRAVATTDLYIFIVDDEGKCWVWRCDIQKLKHVDKDEFEEWLRDEFNDLIVEAMMKEVD